VDEVVFRSSVIVNCAAETHVDRSIQGASPFVMTNVYGTGVMLEASRKYAITKFVHLSTDEVYGSCSEGSFSEESPLNPGNPYSASKAAADLLALAYHATYGHPVTILRSSNVFGPYQYPEKLIPLLVTNALEDKRLPLYGDGLNLRDWIYVEDLCEALDVVLRRGAEGEIYNVAASNERTNLEMAHGILDHVGKSRNLVTFVPDRPAHDRRYALDWSKIRDLGWRPRHSFAEALEKTIEWFRDNEPWWRKIKRGQKAYREYYRRQYPELTLI
jgi:dTDP-glucose 4,6-dehydratase